MRSLGKASNPNKIKTDSGKHKKPVANTRRRSTSSLARMQLAERESVLIGVTSEQAHRIWKRLSYGLFLAVLTYGLITGGHISYGFGVALNKVDELVRDAGFGITTVEIVGRKHSREKDILTVLGAKDISIIRFNTQKAKESIEQLEWIESARVMRIFPSTVKVIVRERKPFALWQSKGQYFLIDTKGVVISEQKRIRPALFEAFPLIVGDGADAASKQLFIELSKHRGAVRSIKAAIRVATRRWTLQLRNGVEILLPEKDVSTALAQISRLDKRYGILSGHIRVIDLRLSDRIILRRFKNNEAGGASEKQKKSYSQVHLKRSGA